EFVHKDGTPRMASFTLSGVSDVDGTTIGFEGVHTFSPEQIEWFKAGSALNVVRKKVAEGNA
ncbi:MAG: hypothetical protein WCK21_06980, partial [Actinomycetota bacterium]